MNTNAPLRLLLLSAALLISACATEAPVDADSAHVRTSAQMMAAVQQAAKGNDERELDVQPLRDSQVEDLREDAANALRRGDTAAAAAALDQALAIVAEDPAVLQERAEVALAQGDLERAEAWALQAANLGSAVGPWCRRHWETVRQVRERGREIAAVPPRRANEARLAEQARLLAEADRGVAEARQRFDTCTVPGINRM